MCHAKRSYGRERQVIVLLHLHYLWLLLRMFDLARLSVTDLLWEPAVRVSHSVVILLCTSHIAGNIRRLWYLASCY